MSETIGSGGCGESNSNLGCAGCAAAKPTKTTQLGKPPGGMDLFKIGLGLTVVCLLCAGVLGGIYLVTEPIRLQTVHVREEKMLRSLLGLPENAKMEEVRRYRTSGMQTLALTSRFLVNLNEDGREVSRQAFPENLVSGAEEEKDKWVKEHAPEAEYAGRFFVGKEGDQIGGYVVEGITSGYKSKVRFFVALDGAFSLRGLEILEQEEDPGLGAEIAQPYFKNQFAGRSAEELSKMKVTKDPLDGDWKAALENFGNTPFSAWLQENRGRLSQHQVVHAITGATISSEAITSGVKKTVANFRRRVDLLKGAL